MEGGVWKFNPPSEMEKSDFESDANGSLLHTCQIFVPLICRVDPFWSECGPFICVGTGDNRHLDEIMPVKLDTSPVPDQVPIDDWPKAVVRRAICAVKRSVKLLKGHFTKALQGVDHVGAAHFGGQVIVVTLERSVIARPSGYGSPRLHDTRSEQLVIPSTICCEMNTHRHGPGRLSPDGDLFGIPAKGSNVLLYPLKGQSLIS